MNGSVAVVDRPCFVEALKAPQYIVGVRLIAFLDLRCANSFCLFRTLPSHTTRSQVTHFTHQTDEDSTAEIAFVTSS